MRRWLQRLRRRLLCRLNGHEWLEVEVYETGEPRAGVHPVCFEGRRPLPIICTVRDCTGKVICRTCRAVALMDYTKADPDATCSD